MQERTVKQLSLEELREWFEDNFVEGQRYDTLLRLAGSCAVAGIDIDDVIEFYHDYRHQDDEDRTWLIERTYKLYNEGRQVLTLKDYGIIIKPNKYKFINLNGEDDILYKKAKELKQRLAKRFSQSTIINIDDYAIPITPKDKEVFYLLSRGLTLEEIKFYDIRKGIQYLENRVVFPVYNLQGQCIYFVARSIDDKIPKYFNAPLPRDGVVWNYVNVIDENEIIVCEGIFNAISAYKYTGIKAVATLGKNITNTQIKMLDRFDRIYLCLDGDVPLNHLYRIAYKFRNKVDIIRLPEDKDVNALDKQSFLTYFNNRIQNANNRR